MAAKKRKRRKQKPCVATGRKQLSHKGAKAQSKAKIEKRKAEGEIKPETGDLRLETDRETLAVKKHSKGWKAEGEDFARGAAKTPTEEGWPGYRPEKTGGQPAI
jgi:hypothetical protein